MRWLVALAAVSWAACATVPRSAGETRTLSARSESLEIHIDYQSEDEAAARQIVASLPSVARHLKRWGDFVTPVTLRILPTHDALEKAVDHPGFTWLRAWARYDSIDVQSPSTWSEGGSPAQVGELLTHELTHCLMYQHGATSSDWANKELPLWFREGMASVTAEQGYRRLTNEELAARMSGSPGLDPLNQADALYQSESRLVYGAAHRSFEFLLERYGDKRVGTLLAALKQGRDFSAALQSATSLSEADFTADFLRFLRWRGWLGRAPRDVPSPLVGAEP